MILTRGRIAVAAVVVAACAVGCASLVAPTPNPTATLDIQSMVEAAVDKALVPTPTPTPDFQSMVDAAINATLTAEATLDPTYTPRPKPASTAKPTRRPTPTPRSIHAPVLTYTPRPTPASPPPPTVIRFTIQPPRVTTVRATRMPESRRLQEVDCGPNCYTDQEPSFHPLIGSAPRRFPKKE